MHQSVLRHPNYNSVSETKCANDLGGGTEIETAHLTVNRACERRILVGFRSILQAFLSNALLTFSAEETSERFPLIMFRISFAGWAESI